jgi:hypothetical protein
MMSDDVGACAIVKIDLSQEILNYNGNSSNAGSRTQRYAYNVEQVVPGSSSSNTVPSICMSGQAAATVAVTGLGVYAGPGPLFYNGATFSTGRIRFGTSENKLFAYLKLRADIGPNATLTVQAQTATSGLVTVGSFTSASNLSQDISLGTIANAPAEWLQLIFTIASAGGAGFATVRSYAVKALPAPKPQRLIQYPLRLNDFEQDRQGLETGYDGSAWTRLQALETLEANGVLTTIVDNTNGETYSGLIQKIQFIRDTPPSRNNKNYGGQVVLTVLKLS